MSLVKITAKRKKTGAEQTVEIEIPDTIQAMVEAWSEETVYSHVKGSIIVAVQGFMRGQLDRGKSPEEVTKSTQEWKPGQRKPGKSPQEKFRDLFGKLSPQERASMLKELRKSPADGQGAPAPQ